MRPGPSQKDIKRPVTVQPSAKPSGKKPGDDEAKPPAKKEPTIRLAAVPDVPDCWQILHESGVDYINTDKIAALAKFLQSRN